MKFIDENECRHVEAAHSIAVGVLFGFFAVMVGGTFAFHGRLVLILCGG